MKPNWRLIEEFFTSESRTYWVERLEKIMQDNKHLKGKSEWYARLETTRDLLLEDKVDRSVMLSVVMSNMGL